jgi:hypothetical protein
MTDKVYVGDTGTIIALDTGVSLSGALSVGIEVCRPDGSKASWVGVAWEETKVRYITEPTTLNMPGVWKLQAKVQMTTGTWLGKTATMVVYATFK